MIYPVDLSAATDAFVGHAIDNLDRAEKYRKTYTAFNATEAFIWSDHNGRRSVLTVSATAQATREKDCYLLHVSFGGEAKDDFRSTHKNDLIAAATAALEAAGWALVQFKPEEDRAVRTNSDGIYFTLTRRQEERAAELEPASTELVS